MVGWHGETFSRESTFGPRPVETAPVEAWLEQISAEPRAFVYHHFLTDKEANHLLQLSAAQLKRSTVVGGNSTGVQDQIRTSYGMFIPRKADAIVTGVEEKLAEWLGVPLVNQEDIQVLRYENGQKYGAHYDSLGRLCTVLIYLTDTEEGGETAFPKTTAANWLDPDMEGRYGPFSSCGEGHVAARPRKGDALLFYSLKNVTDGETSGPSSAEPMVDDLSMHTGCPVIKGIKYTATVWVHPDAFRPEWLADESRRTTVGRDPGFCQDSSPQCPNWAASGECEKNPMYMSTKTGGSGECSNACGDCELCASKSEPCYQRNRDIAQYATVFDEVDELVATQHVGQPLFN